MLRLASINHSSRQIPWYLGQNTMKSLASQFKVGFEILNKWYFDQLGQFSWGFSGLILLIAILYSSVGFGGASGYLIIMALYNIPNNVAVSAALTLNLIVAGISFFNYSRNGYFKPKLLFPFVVASIPAAFIGGTFQLEQFTYLAILHSVLFITAIRMLIDFKGIDVQTEITPPSTLTMILVGAGLGLLAGMIGIGGGVLLSPLIILAKWGNPKDAAATAAGFILLNSLSGILGRVFVGSYEIGSFGISLIPVVLIGSIVGSSLGARYLSGTVIKRLLGTLMLIVVAQFVWNLFI